MQSQTGRYRPGRSQKPYPKENNSYGKAPASKIGLKNIKGDAKNVYITFEPETFNFDVWMDLADDIEKEIRLSITSNDTLRAQIRKEGDTIDLINKMFEKYFEILKNHT